MEKICIFRQLSTILYFYRNAIKDRCHSSLIVSHLLFPAAPGDIAMPTIRLSVCLSITFSFRTVTRNALMYFLET